MAVLGSLAYLSSWLCNSLWKPLGFPKPKPSVRTLLNFVLCSGRETELGIWAWKETNFWKHPCSDNTVLWTLEWTVVKIWRHWFLSAAPQNLADDYRKFTMLENGAEFWREKSSDPLVGPVLMLQARMKTHRLWRRRAECRKTPLKQDVNVHKTEERNECFFGFSSISVVIHHFSKKISIQSQIHTGTQLAYNAAVIFVGVFNQSAWFRLDQISMILPLSRLWRHDLGSEPKAQQIMARDCSFPCTWWIFLETPHWNCF